MAGGDKEVRIIVPGREYDEGGMAMGTAIGPLCK